MVKGKTRSVLIKLVSQAGSGYFYTTKRNVQFPRKIQLRKYDPIVNEHVLFKEEKISRAKKR